MNLSRQNTDSTPAAGPGGMSGADELEAQRLTLLFINEPELIPACLESLDADQTLNPHIILAATERAIKQRPKYADLLYYAAQAALRVNRLEQARTLLGSALEINPNYNAAMILAARVCTLQGRQSEALNYLRQAVFSGADYADVHLMMGDLWRERDEITHAREAYNRALQINANLPTAREKLTALENPTRSGGTNELPA